MAPPSTSNPLPADRVTTALVIRAFVEPRPVTRTSPAPTAPTICVKAWPAPSKPMPSMSTSGMFSQESRKGAASLSRMVTVPGAASSRSGLAEPGDPAIVTGPVAMVQGRMKSCVLAARATSTAACNVAMGDHPAPGRAGASTSSIRSSSILRKRLIQAPSRPPPAVP